MLCSDFTYYTFKAFKGRKEVLSITLCSFDAMANCVLMFKDHYEKIVISTILTGKDEKEDD